MDVINYSKIKKVEEDLAQHKTDILEHFESAMPHKFQDLKNSKIYKFGFQVSEGGNPQIIYKEVI